MVDDRKCDPVEVSDLPEFFGNAKLVSITTRFDIATLDFQEFPRSIGRDDTTGNLQPEGCGPEAVGLEDILLAIPHVQIRTRSLQRLFFLDQRIDLGITNGLRQSVRQNGSHAAGCVKTVDPEVGRRRGHNSGSIVGPKPKLQYASDCKVIDSTAGVVVDPFESHIQVVTR